jgi:hypothetical protein
MEDDDEDDEDSSMCSGVVFDAFASDSEPDEEATYWRNYQGLAGRDARGDFVFHRGP